MGGAIHPTAIISPQASIGDGVEIGPWCVIEGPVALAAGARLMSHVCVSGNTTIGEACTIYPFASIGHAPQSMDQEQGGELHIGPRTIIREYVTMNPGTRGGSGATRIGSDGLFMALSHVAHDCLVGDHVVFANQATLGGHCTVGDHAILSGGALCQQRVRIGAHAFLGGGCGAAHDVPCFLYAWKVPAQLYGVNVIGLKRRGFSHERIHRLRAAYRQLFEEEGSLRNKLDGVEARFSDSGDVKQLIDFIRAGKNPICAPRLHRGGDAQ